MRSVTLVHMLGKNNELTITLLLYTFENSDKPNELDFFLRKLILTPTLNYGLVMSGVLKTFGLIKKLLQKKMLIFGLILENRPALLPM